MSRSKRKSPFTGITSAESDKAFKRHANRALRKTQKQLIAKAEETALVLPAKGRDMKDVWSSRKEGKSRLDLTHPGDRRQMRK